MTKSYLEGRNFKLEIITTSILVVIIATSPLLITMSQAKAQGQEAAPGSVFKLARANIPIDIPLAKGYENGNEIFFIATELLMRK
jgi:hypothetical protein